MSEEAQQVKAETEEFKTEENEQLEQKETSEQENTTSNPPKEEESDDEEVEYECPCEFNEREEMKKMFVGGLDRDTKDEEFKSLFTAFGEITDFIIIRKDGKSDRLFGFITFEKCDDLEECLLARPHKYKEKDLDVKRAVPKGQDDGHVKCKKLHVANIPAEFSKKDLKKYLLARHPKKYGVIEEINLLKQKDEQGNPTDKNRGFGFITVSTEDFADRIAIGETKFTLNGHDMRISKAKPKSEGGRGGYKGQRSGGHQQHGGWGGGDYGPYGGYGGYGPYGGYAGYDYYGNPTGYYGGGYYGGGPARRGGGARFNPY